jgi:hypothetical protein
MKDLLLTLFVSCFLLLVAGCQGQPDPAGSATPATAAAASNTAQAGELLMGGADIESVAVSETFDTVNNPRLEAGGGLIGSIEKGQWKQFGQGSADQPLMYKRGYSKNKASEFEASTFTITYKDGREIVVNLPAHQINTDGQWSVGDIQLDKGMYIGADGTLYADAQGKQALPATAAPESSASGSPEAEATP